MNTKKILAGLGALAVAAFVAVTIAQAASTIDLTTGGGQSVRPASAPTPVILQKTVDFSVTNAASGGTFYVLRLPGTCMVERVFYRVVTGNGTGANVTIGDNASATAFTDTVQIGTNSSGAVSASNQYNSASTYVTLTAGTAITAAKLDIRVQAVILGESVP
jgi:hypothetical protein